MLCINKRLYRCDWPDRCNRRYGCNRCYRCNGNSRTGQLPFRLCDAGPDRNERDNADL